MRISDWSSDVCSSDLYLSACEWLDAANAPAIAAESTRVLADPESVARLQHWVRYYFGDTAPGAATTRFHAAIETLMDRWEPWHSRPGAENDVDAADEAHVDDCSGPASIRSLRRPDRARPAMRPGRVAWRHSRRVPAAAERRGGKGCVGPVTQRGGPS